MKVLVILCFAALAAAEIDWSKVQDVEDMPGFWDGRDPQLYERYMTAKRQNRGGRIVNGEIARDHQFPYQCAQITNYSGGTASLCGASVISPTAVLTAAHCSNPATAVSFEIIAGAINRRLQEPNQQRKIVPASGWIQHPAYNALLHNDVAVIRFPTDPFTFNEFVQPIALASNVNELFVGHEVHVSGFGRISDSTNETSDFVRFTVKNVITNDACRLRFLTLVVDSTICAIGDLAINNAVCNGDSGGPLAIRRDGRSLQVGIVSFGSPLGCERGVPDGYARVTHFYEWISQVAPL